jgi:hypothetical protein
MNPEDEQPDDLTREYRSVSAADAGRPAAATRAAILAEARAAALRRRPAANDSGIWWRAAASVAVVGVGLLIWRQVDRAVAPLAPYAGNAVTAKAEPEAEADASVESRADATAPAQARAQPPAAPAPSAAGGAANAEKRAERAPATQAFDAPASPARPALSLREASISSPTNLLQDRFPSEFTSALPPRAVWVLQDEAGGVLRSGKLDDNEAFDAATQRLQAEFPGRRIGPWSVTPVTNARGVAVQLGVAVIR